MGNNLRLWFDCLKLKQPFFEIDAGIYQQHFFWDWYGNFKNTLGIFGIPKKGMPE